MEKLLEQFEEEGFVVLDLLDATPLLETRAKLEDHLATLLGERIALEDYHKLVKEDEFHISLQTQMTEFYRKGKFAKKVIKAQLPFFTKLVGIDLLVQQFPYLRMARPEKSQDNVGYHRDTFYGGSPYEISVILPFVECDAGMTLKVMPKSHILSEELFQTKQEISADVVKGSDKHNLGFLYAPKMMDKSTEEKMVPVPIKLGQVLMFSLSIVHGCVINKGTNTRWTSDVRLLNALSPVDLSARPDYYEPCHSSAVTSSAEKYFAANNLQCASV
ncbi:MAG: hypothetical protein SP1CHLAM54_15400 [Chlamydiia bacterium]|nr:hypothetical protein [Chlamydiia bacterium]MCH9616430.1 hypothetical protein [Chlamydiia bacterium]MCH9629584.1 hypothetical protein [Chlamydiia bacterium]